MIDPQKLIEHYNRIFHNQEIDFRNSNLRKLVVAAISAPGKVLDIGCGTGHLTLALLEKGLDVVATDILKEMTEYTRSVTKDRGYDIRTGIIGAEGIANSFPVSSFDYVTLIDVLEHIKDDNQALIDIRSVLKDDGRLVLVVPAYQFCYGERDRQMGHYRRYDLADLLAKVKKTGYAVERIRYWNFLCLVPYIVSERILKKRIDENLRYNERITKFQGILMRFLGVWFRNIENRINFGSGLSIFVVLRKYGNKEKG